MKDDLWFCCSRTPVKHPTCTAIALTIVTDIFRLYQYLLERNFFLKIHKYILSLKLTYKMLFVSKWYLAENLFFSFLMQIWWVIWWPYSLPYIQELTAVTVQRHGRRVTDHVHTGLSGKFRVTVGDIDWETGVLISVAKKNFLRMLRYVIYIYTYLKYNFWFKKAWSKTLNISKYVTFFSHKISVLQFRPSLAVDAYSTNEVLILVEDIIHLVIITWSFQCNWK